jgi:membrane associated rhomboid family serine protease
MDGQLNFTILIVIITCIVSYIAEENPVYKSKLLHNAFLVRSRHEYYRWLTSGFVHSGYIHLAFNMIALYSFGNVLENIILGQLIGANWSSIYFLIFYLVAIIVSDLPSYFRFRNSPAYNSLGASGGVSAVVMAVILFYPALPIRLMFIPFDIPGFLFAVLYLVYTAYMTQNSQDNVNHTAHLYGSLFGIIFAVFISPNVIMNFFSAIANWRPFF